MMNIQLCRSCGFARAFFIKMNIKIDGKAIEILTQAKRKNRSFVREGEL